MQRYIVDRIFQAIICLLVMSALVFFLVRLTGDPVEYLISDQATQEDYDRIYKAYGFDEPYYIQYILFLKNMITGDLGDSLYLHRPVADILKTRFPATLQLALVAIIISLVVGLPLGVYAAVKRGTGLDVSARFLAILGQSMPPFWLGLMLILIFAVWFRILPSGGKGGVGNLILPGITMASWLLAGITRLTRSSMLDVLGTEYVKLARIKGASEPMVIWKHAFKNALLPVVTFSAVMSVILMAGAVITETVFAWPGLGQLVIQSVMRRDFPVTQAVVLLMAALYIGANLLVDITYAFLNPKIRYAR